LNNPVKLAGIDLQRSYPQHPPVKTCRC
jgi:hypothetical protein